MERILIKEDQARFNATIKGYSQLSPALEKLKENYEQLNLGTFSEAIFKDITVNGSSNIAEAYKAELNKQLDKAGVTFPALRKQQYDSSLHPLHDFMRAVNELPTSITAEYSTSIGRYPVNYLLSYAAYDDNAAEFTPYTEETKESILEEFCRTHTETESEYKVWISAQELLVAYDKMKEAIKEAGAESHFIGSFGTLQIDRIIRNKEGDLSVNTDLIDTVRSVASWQLAQHRRHEENQRKNQEAKAKREEAHKRAFDISTPEGTHAFKAASAQKEREQKAEMQRKGYLV